MTLERHTDPRQRHPRHPALSQESLPRWHNFRRAFVTGMMAVALLGTVVYGGVGDRTEAERPSGESVPRTAPVQPPRGTAQGSEMKAAKSPRKLCVRATSQQGSREATEAEGVSFGVVRAGWVSVARLTD